MAREQFPAREPVPPLAHDRVRLPGRGVFTVAGRLPPQAGTTPACRWNPGSPPVRYLPHWQSAQVPFAQVQLGLSRLRRNVTLSMTLRRDSRSFSCADVALCESAARPATGLPDDFTGRQVIP